jgi:hypothetical protein
VLRSEKFKCKSLGKDETQWQQMIWNTLVEWQDCDHFVPKFQLKSETAVLKVKYPISELRQNSQVQARTELQYLPVIVNHATTGHKLQGKPVKSLVLSNCRIVKGKKLGLRCTLPCQSTRRSLLQYARTFQEEETSS